MSLTHTIARNIVSNWLGFAVSIAVAFVLTPYVLHTLGGTRYGAWSLVISITGYYGLLDLGFRAGLTQYLARYLAAKDFDRLNRTASTGFYTLLFLGILLVAASIGLVWLATLFVEFPKGTEKEFPIALVIVGITVALQFPFFPFSAVFSATQRYDVSNAIGISTSLINALATYWLLSEGYGLVGISSANLIANLLDYLMRWLLAYRVLPQLDISWRAFDWSSWREFTHFGLWNVGIATSQRVISLTDAIVIGWMISVAAVAPFALASNLARHFGRLFVPVGKVFFPAATALDVKGDVRNLRRMYLVGSRLLFSLSIAMGTVAAFLADDFIRLWLGSVKLEGDYGSTSIPFLFRILLLAAVLTAGQRIGYQVLLGTRRVRVMALFFSCEAAANLILSIVLAIPFGITGVAVGTLIPAAIFQFVVHPVALCRILEIPSSHFLLRVVARPFGVGAVLTPFLLMIRLTSPPAANWQDLILTGSLAATVAGLSLWGIGITGTERQRIRARLVGSLKSGPAAVPHGDK